MTYKVGCCQYDPKLLDIKGNLEKMEALLDV